MFKDRAIGLPKSLVPEKNEILIHLDSLEIDCILHTITKILENGFQSIGAFFPNTFFPVLNIIKFDWHNSQK